ncbi:Beta-monoglucosyldiacylglycerol synthase [Roseivivax jejudonensis]|uniref:Beta-monoglucosyldiacylglycerol synthase n=1 Tax=Roseivivax jejudonensis TaxID=1529041 RepID=A0A1X6Z3E5_9RHOB|nr:glycosyltransferase [Roseivivax jejudonensis]SLN39348.1 Beta-monoglucosyldiacylglycerol synthase [Roseivivax jejudonensis]
MTEQPEDSARLIALTRARQADHRPPGGRLLDQGEMPADALLAALGEAHFAGQPLDRVVGAREDVRPDAALRLRGRASGLPTLDRTSVPPDPALAQLLRPETCLALRVLPWRMIGDTLLLAAADPAAIDKVTPLLAERVGRIMPALASEGDIESELAERHAARFARAAETDVAADQSCRDLGVGTPLGRATAAAATLGCTAGLVLAPQVFFLAVLALAGIAMFASQALKLAGALAAPRGSGAGMTPVASIDTPRPVVSLLVPLFQEAEIAATLVSRLRRLSYPKSALDVLLVLEAGDDATRRAIARATLPPWIRVIEVPPGGVTTKPRALNYARRFARSSILGVLDAEDAPAANQVDRVVARFADAGPDLACLQGVLDFYNPHANWLSRMFAIEYATWFRLVLPGLARLGLVVPLGGTTVYFRRAALEAVGGWDAHNVTEDADLGVRLARHGFRTELVATVTLEEANNRLWPWVRQRSRWLKGYMMTWATHTRRPRRLLRDLGPVRALGVQALFLGAILQALLAPLLWSLWIVPFGLPHPVLSTLSAEQMAGLVALMLGSEAITLCVGFAAVARTPHRGLTRWVPTTLCYFPLTVAAAYKALWEALRTPFYWDKTAHGASPPDHRAADCAPE